ncbi:MAG: hypothetical protein PHQ72_06400 [Hespellia sp.]|nr:hypothetical protein [Hespellia sp.]
MRGYLNYFENECNFIADTAYTIKSGSSVSVCSGDCDGQTGVFQSKNGIASLIIDGQEISKLQGIVLEIADDYLAKKYEENSRSKK